MSQATGGPPDTVDATLTGWQFRAVVWSTVLSAAGYLLFSLLGGWREVLSAILEVGLLGVAALLSLSLMNYVLRFARWQLYLRSLGHHVDARLSLSIYVAGFALTTTPGKAGEMFRGVLLRRRGVPYPDTFAAFLSERLSDLVAVVMLALLGVFIYPDARPLIYLGAILCISLLVLLSSKSALSLVQRGYSRIKIAPRAVAHLVEMLSQAQRCHRQSILVVATLLSLAGWAAEAFGLYLILHWIDADVSIEFAIFVFAISMLAGALTLTPGGLGSTEGVMAGLLIWNGVVASDAVAATLLIRAVTLWFAVALGVVAVPIAKSMFPLNRHVQRHGLT